MTYGKRGYCCRNDCICCFLSSIFVFEVFHVFVAFVRYVMSVIFFLEFSKATTNVLLHKRYAFFDSGPVMHLAVARSYFNF